MPNPPQTVTAPAPSQLPQHESTLITNPITTTPHPFLTNPLEGPPLGNAPVANQSTMIQHPHPNNPATAFCKAPSKISQKTMLNPPSTLTPLVPAPDQCPHKIPENPNPFLYNTEPPVIPQRTGSQPQDPTAPSQDAIEKALEEAMEEAQKDYALKQNGWI